MRETKTSKGKHSHIPSEERHGGATLPLEHDQLVSASLTSAAPNLESHQTRTCIHGGKLHPLQC